MPQRDQLTLSSDIRHMQSSHAFKTALKTHIYKQYHKKQFQILSSSSSSPQKKNPPTLSLPITFLLCTCVCVGGGVGGGGGV